MYAPGTEFAIDIITMIGNTGTYLGSPFHRYGDRGDLASLDFETVADLPVIVVHRRGVSDRAIDVDEVPDSVGRGRPCCFTRAGTCISERMPTVRMRRT